MFKVGDRVRRRYGDGDVAVGPVTEAYNGKLFIKREDGRRGCGPNGTWLLAGLKHKEEPVEHA